MIKMKKISLLLAALLIFPMIFGACNRGEAPIETSDVISSEAPATSAPEVESTAKPLNTEAKSSVNVVNPDWGYAAHSVKSADESIVKAELKKGSGDVVLTSYNPGETEVYVLDCFEHKAIINVKVADDGECSITYEANPCREEFINAATYGIVPGATPNNLPDQSSKLQMVIDKVWKQGGGTIFLYPGFYNISVITMRDGVTLKMYSGFTDAREGYTEELAEKVKNGEVTVLILARILNTKMKEFGRNGSSNFTVSGGVIDNNHSTQSILLFGLSKGITIENMIFKDIKNNHVIQVTGCEDVTIRNCIFAGFEWGGTFTRETIQVEQSHPGAHSSNHANAPVRFEQGEIYGSKNVTIDSCYFGPSDELPGAHIAIGHHGTAHEAVCDGFKITNNVFDRPTYAAIRFASIVDVEITGNKFIATKDANKFCEEADPSFIIIYPNTGTVSYENIVDGRKITKAVSNEQAGSHNLNISNNEFTVERGSDKKIITVKGTSLAPGAVYKSGLLRQDSYNSTPYSLSGYFKSTNYISNVNFSDNKITYSGQPLFKDDIVEFTQVYGYKFENNDINLTGCTFKNSEDGVNGIFISGCKNGVEAQTYTVQSSVARNYISLTHPNGSEAHIVFTSSQTHNIVALEGGHIEITSDNSGNVYFKPVADEGYTFTGWTTANGALNDQGNVKIKDKTVFTANFAKQ